MAGMQDDQVLLLIHRRCLGLKLMEGNTAIDGRSKGERGRWEYCKFAVDNLFVLGPFID